MVELVPVLEQWSSTGWPAVAWPIAESDRLLALHGALSPVEVGTAIRVLVATAIESQLRTDDPLTADDALMFLIDYIDPAVWCPFGGLLVRDRDTGFAAAPGCCCDLADWRNWCRAAVGRYVDTGHDIAPVVEHRGDIVRVWGPVYVDDDEPIPPGTPFVEFPRAAVGPMLQAVQRDLIGFLGRAADWARASVPDLAEELRAALDRKLEVTAPITFE